MPRALTDPMLLLDGVPAGASSSPTGAATDDLTKVVTAASAIGTAKSQTFVLPAIGQGFLELAAALAATITGFKVDLEQTYDNGVNWRKVVLAIDLFTNGNVASIGVAGGGVYRLNITTYAGAGNADVFATFTSVAR